MKIVADENIAGLQEYFAAYGEIVALPGRSISWRDLQDADVLLVRSVTTVNQTLLEQSRVRFVGSCTIGTDHLDIGWLEQQQICWTHAPGCNTKAVVDYVLSCLLALELDLSALTVGIIGCGNVGSLLDTELSRLGVNTRCCDPFLVSSPQKTYFSLEDLLPVCDVLCLHTPLTLSGPHPTFHLIHERNLSRVKPDGVLLNAGRGAVVDNQTLLEFSLRHPDFRMVLDVWEHEPLISKALLERATVATPHIAGYSLAGKWRGTAMIHKCFCDFFSLPFKNIPLPSGLTADLCSDMILKDYVLGVYNPLQDSERLKRTLSLGDEARAKAFDELRKNYSHRLELPASLTTLHRQ